MAQYEITRTCIIDAERLEAEDRLKDMEEIELEDLVAFIEEAHTAKTAQALRQKMVYGVGALINSESCAWTELDTYSCNNMVAGVSAVEVSDVPYDIATTIQLFNKYAWQHPVIKHLISTGKSNAISISEIQDQTNFHTLELYRLLYKPLSVEDQLSVGFIEDGTVIGLSVNRASWGFTDNERHTLSRIANSVFPFYRALSRLEFKDSQPQTLIEASINNLSMHSETLGITAREAELLMHVAYGLGNKQIAATCSISEGTVRKHLENAFRKLGVTNRVRAIIRAADIIHLAD